MFTEEDSTTIDIEHVKEFKKKIQKLSQFCNF